MKNLLTQLTLMVVATVAAHCIINGDTPTAIYERWQAKRRAS